MWHSTESYFKMDKVTAGGDGVQCQSNTAQPMSKATSKTGGNDKKKVVEPNFTSMNVSQPSQPGGRTTMAAVVQEQMHRTKASKRRTGTLHCMCFKDIYAHSTMMRIIMSVDVIL